MIHNLPCNAISSFANRNFTFLLESWIFFFFSVSRFQLELNPDNPNSDSSKSSLIRSNNHSPWTALLLIFTSLVRTLLFRTIFLSPWEFELTGSTCTFMGVGVGGNGVCVCLFSFFSSCIMFAIKIVFHLNLH